MNQDVLNTKLEMALREIIGLLEYEWMQGDGIPLEAVSSYHNACRLIMRIPKWKRWEPII